MADFIAAVGDSSITVTPMTVDAVNQRERELNLDESMAYGDGVGVSTEAAHDASGARGHLSSGE